MTQQLVPRFLFGEDRASCAETGPGIADALFFPERDGREMTEAAKAVCAQCPLLRPCAEYALTHAVHGTWGGLTTLDRATLQRKHGLPVLVRWSNGNNRTRAQKRFELESVADAPQTTDPEPDAETTGAPAAKE